MNLLLMYWISISTEQSTQTFLFQKVNKKVSLRFQDLPQMSCGHFLHMRNALVSMLVYIRSESAKVDRTCKVGQE